MNLYYLVATEPPKPRKPEVEMVHAIIAYNDEHLTERCNNLFIKFSAYHLKHKLNKDWK